MTLSLFLRQQRSMFGGTTEHKDYQCFVSKYRTCVAWQIIMLKVEIR